MRLQTAYAFTLMARIFPRTDAFRVLQRTEEVENLGKLASFIAASVAFGLRLEPTQIGAVVFVAVSMYRLVHLFGFFVPPLTFLLPVSRVYSFVSGYGVLFAALIIFGFLMSGWKGIFAFALARIGCGALFGVIELAHSKHVFRQTGLALTASERSFFHAFRLEASRLGASTDLAVSDDEVASQRWKLVYEDLAKKWPIVVNRFTGDDV